MILPSPCPARPQSVRMGRTPSRTTACRSASRASRAICSPSNGTLTPGERDAVEQLARSIEDNAPVPAPRPPAPDVEAWAAAHADHTRRPLARRRVVLRRARLLSRESRRRAASGRPDAIRSPPRRRRSSPGARPGPASSRRSPCAARARSVSHGLLDACLWGNRVDLSYTVAASRERAARRRSARRRARQQPFRSSSGPAATCTSSPTTPAPSSPSTSRWWMRSSRRRPRA